MPSLLLKIDAITKSYGTNQALKGVSLDLYEGEIFSLLGVNGAGKTTLSSIIATLHPPTSGDIFFNGQSIYNNLSAYRSIMGYCPQKPNLNPMLSLYDNLAFAGYYYAMDKDAIDARIKQLSDQLDLTRYLQSKSDELSGGYKQRFLFARSMMHRPKLVILDEPTVALDPHIRQELWKCIKTMKSEGVTILLTTHYLEEAEVLSDRVCLLDQGRIQLIDTPQNLMNTFQKGRLEDVFLHLINENSVTL